MDMRQNIAFQKRVHVSSGKEMARNITDGNSQTFWHGEYYPAYIDVNLENNYHIEEVEVDFQEEQELCYTIYTSMNGRDFETLATNKEGRIVRILIEYAAPNSKPIVKNVRVFGTKCEMAVVERPEIQVCPYDRTKYCDEIAEQDIYEEVYGIIRRRIGELYCQWFELELAENPVEGHDFDYYELTDRNGKIHIKGNNGVSLATGLHYYLKYFCKVHISQVGDRVNMPASVIPVWKVVFRETKAKVRYAYNYCTFSYSMAFYGRKEWRDELDWLALNGVNLILDITGQEEVWRRFLGEFGYSHEHIKDFIVGPAYYAWAYMANMSGFGGPVHDSWFEERTELARENHRIMRTLGMQPVLQGYSGMVPNDIDKYDAEVEVIKQGEWNGFQRPDMLLTTSACFEKYAQKFYRAQKEVYGDVSHYYATDPFHEGGNTGGMSAREISSIVLETMLNADKDAVWMIQSWQHNPTSELLAGIETVTNGKKHALILDLYAERWPHFGEGSAENKAFGYEPEFNHTPWIFCMLNNFGGRLGLHGHLDNLATYIPDAFNRCSNIAGIGITPEASANNPVLYDFLFETIWQENANTPMKEIELNNWIEAYAERRYGATSDSVKKAWQILLQTVYKAEFNALGEGAPECIANARPARKIRAASTWGNTVVSYDMKQLERAKELLLNEYEALKSSEGYRYDVAAIKQQVLSNKSLECYQEMIMALENQQQETFREQGKKFLELIDEMEQVTATNVHYRLDKWIGQAERLAEHTDDFSKKMYVWNAKMLITTWGSYEQSEKGRLHDYSNRQWAGLIKEFYRSRWERWIADPEATINWFAWEWNWTRGLKSEEIK